VYNLNDNSAKWPSNNIGIYCFTSKYNNKKYIGLTRNKKGFKGRWKRHRELLRKNKHDNPYLQHAYNKYGETNFNIDVVEVCNKNDNLEIKEYQYIEHFKALYIQNGYNIDTYDRYQKRKTIYRPLDTNKHMLCFKFIDPTGNIVSGKNVTKFCRENNLSDDAMRGVLHGRLYSHKGYKAVNSKKVKKEYRLLSPKKELFVFNNITQFAKKNNLGFGNVSAVLLNKSPHAKGWHLEEPLPIYKLAIEIFFQQYAVLLPDNIIYKFTKPRRFAILHNIPPVDNYYNFLAGKRSNFTKKYNWKIPNEEDFKTKNIIEVY
jgi:hypothetical protein